MLCSSSSGSGGGDGGVSGPDSGGDGGGVSTGVGGLVITGDSNGVAGWFSSTHIPSSIDNISEESV